MSQRHLVPAPEVTEQDIDAFAEQQGWTLSDVFPASAESPYEKVWVTPEGEGGVHFVEDHRTGVNYLTALGDQADPMLDRLEQGLHMLTLPELRDEFDNAVTPNQALMAVVRAGVSAPPEADPGYLKLLVDGMHHESPDVRLLAVTAAGYPSWPELREPLTEVISSDEDEDVRETAEDLLEALGPAAS